ncbi:arachidonate 5-lipoxygenase-activating protein isoform X4 [Nycticebus coucang]|uniref:arachidonate 5-lipoxygenase-activating protein isoform X4 n=1 Tax=Nycticebus coucang TaxID=9470 RepID=UPI00234C879A|nr:arachidonate 5-lipoxygenase-activating protein isoform X4 [Nycticebus coucang]
MKDTRMSLPDSQAWWPHVAMVMEACLCQIYGQLPRFLIAAGFFAHKVERESKTQNGRSFQRTGTLAFERVYTANQNCVDAYPTFLAVLWTAGLLCSQVPAAFAGLMYLFVRQKYFVGYLGERTQSTPGYIFGKRIILFLFLMSLAGIFNYYLILLFGSDFENYIKAITTTISPLLLIP